MSENDFKNWQTEAFQILEKYDTQSDGSTIVSQRTQFPVLKIQSKFIIFRLIGLLKSHFSKYNIDIYFRGQNMDHEFKQLPSLFRKLEKISIHDPELKDQSFGKNGQFNLHQLKLNEESIYSFFQQYLRFKSYHSFFYRVLNKNGIIIPHYSISEKINNSLAIESILQHYGYNTRWLDIVDNLDIGLWFSTVDYEKSKSRNKTVTYEGSSEMRARNSGYLFVYGVHTQDQTAQGIKDGKTQRIVDLRQVVSDHSLRPLVQHGYSFSDFSILESQKVELDGIDLNRYLLCVLEIDHERIQDYLFIPSPPSSNIPECFKYETIIPPQDQDHMFEYIEFMSKYTKQIMICLIMGKIRPSITLNQNQINILTRKRNVDNRIIEYFKRTHFRDTDKKIIDNMLHHLIATIDFEKTDITDLEDKIDAYVTLISYVIGKF